MKRYFLRRSRFVAGKLEHENTGPFSAAQLCEMLGAGELTRDTPCADNAVMNDVRTVFDFYDEIGFVPLQMPVESDARFVGAPATLPGSSMPAAAARATGLLPRIAPNVPAEAPAAEEPVSSMPAAAKRASGLLPRVDPALGAEAIAASTMPPAAARATGMIPRAIPGPPARAVSTMPAAAARAAGLVARALPAADPALAPPPPATPAPPVEVIHQHFDPYAQVAPVHPPEASTAPAPIVMTPIRAPATLPVDLRPGETVPISDERDDLDDAPAAKRRGLGYPAQFTIGVLLGVVLSAGGALGLLMPTTGYLILAGIMVVGALLIGWWAFALGLLVPPLALSLLVWGFVTVYQGGKFPGS